MLKTRRKKNAELEVRLEDADVIDLREEREARELTACPYCGGEISERLGAKVCAGTSSEPGCGHRFGDLELPEIPGAPA